MMLTLALVPLFALRADAQDVSWSDLALGDRVEVTFHCGNTISGTLVASSAKVSSLDYTKESTLVLDVTYEYPGLNGTMTVPKKELKSVRKLRVLDEKTKRNLDEIKKKIAADNAKPVEPKIETAPVEPVVKPETPDDAAKRAAIEKARKEAEELKKAMEFYAKFPSPYWGPDRHTMDNQKRARGQAWSAAEAEFEKDYEKLWEKGRAASVPKKD